MMTKTKELKVGSEEFMISLWDKFDEIMEEEGYELLVNTDTPSIPRGTVCFMENDKYVPIISCYIWEDTQASIFVKNRNGNAVIDGNTISINRLRFTDEDKKEDVEKRFKDMVISVLEKYKKYNKQDRLDFDVDTEKVEEINW